MNLFFALTAKGKNNQAIGKKNVEIKKNIIMHFNIKRIRKNKIMYNKYIYIYIYISPIFDY